MTHEEVEMGRAKEMTYYAAVGDGRRWVEVLVTRRDGRQVSQVPTGVAYKTTREMMAALEAKNR